MSVVYNITNPITTVIMLTAKMISDIYKIISDAIISAYYDNNNDIQCNYPNNVPQTVSNILINTSLNTISIIQPIPIVTVKQNNKCIKPVLIKIPV